MFAMKDILKLIPHRYPFLLVDKVNSLDLEQGTVEAQKNVTINEAYFQGHFPAVPIMPGVLILEALAQAGGILVHQHSKTDKIAVLLTVNNAKFRRPVHPGDILMLRCKGLLFSSKGGKVRAEAHVEGKVVAEAEIGFALVDKDQI